MESVLRFLLILIMTIEVIVIVKYEHKKFLTYISPGILISAPLYVVVLIAYLLGGALGYIQIAITTLLIFVVGIPYFVVIGNLFAGRKVCIEIPSYQLSIATANETEKKLKNHKIVRNTTIISFVLIFCFIINVLVFNNELLELLGTDKFGEKLSSGFVAHLFIVAMLCAIIILGTFSKKEWYALIPFCIICGYAMLLGVKYNLVIILLGGLILRIINGKMKLKFVYCAITAIVLFLLCICIYLLEFALNGSEINLETFIAVFKHLTKYLFSGTLAMGETIEKTIPSPNIMLMFRPLITILNGLTLGVLDIPFAVLDNPWDGWVYIGVNNTISVNVSSFFGAIYLANGILGLIIIIPIISILVYSAFNIALKRNNLWLKAAYVVIATPLALSWFGYYYNLLTFYELYFFCIVIYAFSRIRENSRLEVMQQKNIKEQENAHKIKR